MFDTYLVVPLYNAFIGLVGFMPFGDAALAIIVLTILMRILLYPIFTASIRTQMGMQAMQGELDAASEKYKNDREALLRERMALLKKYKVNPFAGFGALIIQLLVIIALYWALFGRNFPAVDSTALYGFIPVPGAVSTNFFGLFDLLQPHNVWIALLVGATQYIAIYITLTRTPARKDSPQAAAQAMQQRMMLYMMPALMAVTTYFFASAVGLYFLVSNLVSILQEWFIRKQFQTKNAPTS